MDNKGEFVNSELIEFAEKFNIVLKTTATESAWSNGMCEKHSGFKGDLVTKIQMDSDCLLQMLTSDQIKKFKQVVGQINLMATQAYPDIAFDSCVMGNSASESTVADLRGINKVVRKVCGQPISLFFPMTFIWALVNSYALVMPVLQIYGIKDPRVVSLCLS